MVDYSKLSFTSKLRYEHVVQKSSVAFSIPGSFGTTTVTIAHNLGYIPFFKLFYSYDADGNIFPVFAGPASFNIDSNNCQVDNVYADSSNIYVMLENDNAAATPITGKVYYRIYAETQA